MPLDNQYLAEYQSLEEAYNALLQEDNPDIPTYVYAHHDGQLTVISDFRDRLKIAIAKLKQAQAIINIKHHEKNQAIILEALKDLGLLLTPSLIQQAQVTLLIKQYQAKLTELHEKQLELAPFNRSLPLLLSAENINEQIIALKHQVNAENEIILNLPLPTCCAELTDTIKAQYISAFDESHDKEALVQTVVDAINDNQSWLGMRWIWDRAAQTQEYTALDMQLHFYNYLLSKHTRTIKIAELNQTISHLEQLTPVYLNDDDSTHAAKTIPQATTCLKAHYPDETFDTLNTVDLYIRVMQAQSSLADKMQGLTTIMTQLKKLEQENQAIIRLCTLHQLTNDRLKDDTTMSYDEKKLANLEDYLRRCEALLPKFSQAAPLKQKTKRTVVEIIDVEVFETPAPQFKG